MKRFSVCMRKTEKSIQPCLVVSPDELNLALPYVMVLPITIFQRVLPFRVPVILNGKKAYLMLDKIQTIPKTDIVDELGVLPEKNQKKICTLLQKMFEV